MEGAPVHTQSPASPLEEVGLTPEKGCPVPPTRLISGIRAASTQQCKKVLAPELTSGLGGTVCRPCWGRATVPLLERKREVQGGPPRPHGEPGWEASRETTLPREYPQGRVGTAMTYQS